MLLEIFSHVRIDELIEECGHKVYVYVDIIDNPIPLNLSGPELRDVQELHLLKRVWNGSCEYIVVGIIGTRLYCGNLPQCITDNSRSAPKTGYIYTSLAA
jgi:hypothetical protein